MNGTMDERDERGERVHGALAGRAMVRWRQDNAHLREQLIDGIEQSLRAAARLTHRRPRERDITCDYGIALDQREPVRRIIAAAYDALYEAIEALSAARVVVDQAHAQLGYIPSEWTQADTVRWSEEPHLYGCTDEDVDAVDRERAVGPFHTPGEVTP